MSLINEALKKAQRMRSENPAPAASGGSDGSPAPVVIRRGRPIPAQVIVLSVLGGAVLIGATTIITLVLLRPDAPAVASAAPAAPAVATAPSPADSSSAPVLVALPSVDPAPASTVATSPAPGQPEPAPSTATPLAPAVATPVPAPQGATAVAATPTPAITPAAPAPAPAKPDPRVQEFLDRLRVSGIRASPTDPRVSMNDRVFRLNEVVDRTLGLRVIGIESSGLIFEDAAGVIYTKSF